MTDIVERLRHEAEAVEHDSYRWGWGPLYKEAADEIERLRGYVERLEDRNADMMGEVERLREALRAIDRTLHFANTYEAAPEIIRQALSGNDTGTEVR